MEDKARFRKATAWGAIQEQTRRDADKKTYWDGQRKDKKKKYYVKMGCEWWERLRKRVTPGLTPESVTTNRVSSLSHVSLFGVLFPKAGWLNT